MAYRSGKYYNAAYTYEEAKLYLTQYKEALSALVDGQAKSYKIGSREVTLIELDDIEKMIYKFAAIVEKYETSARPPRSVAVVFRDT
jgi:hypothetical protein